MPYTDTALHIPLYIDGMQRLPTYKALSLRNRAHTLSHITFKQNTDKFTFASKPSTFFLIHPDFIHVTAALCMPRWELNPATCGKSLKVIVNFYGKSDI